MDDYEKFDAEMGAIIILNSCVGKYAENSPFVPRTPAADIIVEVCRDYGLPPSEFIVKYEADRRKEDRRQDPTKVWDGDKRVRDRRKHHSNR